MLTLMMVLSISLVGCGSSNTLSNEYIKVTDYKTIEIDKVKETKVTDEMVDQQIDGLLEQYGKKVDIKDRPVESGDIAIIDYKGYLDGEAFDGGSEEGKELVIGSKSFIEGFEDGIIGHNIGDNFDLNLTFPEDYNGDLAGKDVVFNVTVKNIQQSQKAELNDDFVKELSEDSKTVEEYRKEVKKGLEEQYKTQTKSIILEEGWKVLVEKAEIVKKPTKEIDDVIKEMSDYYKSMAQSYGMEFPDFLTNYMGMTEEEFEKESKKAAEDSVKQKMIIKLLAEKENLTPSKEEYKKKFKELAKEQGSDDVDAFVEQYGEETLKDYVLQDIVSDWLVDNCKQVEKKK